MSSIDNKKFKKLYYKYKFKYLKLKNDPLQINKINQLRIKDHLQKGGDTRYLNKYVKIKKKNVVYDLSIFSLDEVIYMNNINVKDLEYITKEEYFKFIKELKTKKKKKKKKKK